MPSIAEEYQFVIGVDTHAASHAFAVVTAVNGAVISQDEFPATSAGVSRAVAWVARRGGQPDEVLVVVGHLVVLLHRAATAPGRCGVRRADGRRADPTDTRHGSAGPFRPRGEPPVASL